jgi:hypothetical protein
MNQPKSWLRSLFSPWIFELQLSESLIPVMILKSRDERARQKIGKFDLRTLTNRKQEIWTGDSVEQILVSASTQMLIG